MKDELLALTSNFIEAYFIELGKCKTRQEAYEKIEDRYRAIFGSDKFAGFDSFNNVLYYHINKMKRRK